MLLNTGQNFHRRHILASRAHLGGLLFVWLAGCRFLPDWGKFVLIKEWDGDGNRFDHTMRVVNGSDLGGYGMEVHGRGRQVNANDFSSQMPSPAKPGSAIANSWRRAIVASSLLFAIVGTAVVCTPAIVTQTALRNQLLGDSFDGLGLTSVVSDASGGWLKPVVMQGIELKDAQGRTVCRIREIRTSKGFLGFLSGDTDLGQLTLVEPDTEIHLNEDGSWPLPFPATPSTVTCSFLIEQGKFKLVVPWRPTPIVELSGLNMSGAVAKDPSGQRMLTVDPFQLFDHEQISEVHSQQNLAMIAPVLSQSTELRGSASVWIDEIRMPLDGVVGEATPTPFPINGRAQFHSLGARLKSELVRQLAMLGGQSTAARLPDRLEIIRDSEVAFSINELGIHHQGMTFLLPELAQGFVARTSGTIAMDEGLDLLLTVQLPQPSSAQLQNPTLALLSQLAKQPIQLVIKGTVSNPVLQASPDFALLDELSRRMAPEQHFEQPKPVTQAMFELIEGVSQADKEKAQADLPGGIFNLIRSIKAEKDRKKQSGK